MNAVELIAALGHINETQRQDKIYKYLIRKYKWVSRITNLNIKGRKNPRKKSGIADLLAFGNGITIWIEVKVPGETLSDEQKEFKKACIQGGCKHIEAESVDDLIKAGL